MTLPGPSRGTKTLSRGVAKTKRNAKSTPQAQNKKGVPEVVKKLPVVEDPGKTKAKPAKVYALGLPGSAFPPLGAKQTPKGVLGPITGKQAVLRSEKNARKRGRQRDKRRAKAEAENNATAKTVEVAKAVAEIIKTVEVLVLS